MNKPWATAPCDFYELYLFQAVVRLQSFTKAAHATGLTQSAITRQIQGIEQALGVTLLERTTRSVRPTPAGEFLFAESAQLLGGIERTLSRLLEEFGGARKEVRVGVSRSVGLAYLPGFFHANLRKQPEVSCRVAYQRSAEIISALESNQLDLGVICPPKRLPRTLQVTHRFEDAFSLIGSPQLAAQFQALAASAPSQRRWLSEQRWLLIEEDSNSGAQLRAWMKQQGLRVEPAMQLDSFDLIINLVALGMGVSLVPIRALALYGRKRGLQRIPMPQRFVRQLVVAMRKQRKPPEYLAAFVANVLF